MDNKYKKREHFLDVVFVIILIISIILIIFFAILNSNKDNLSKNNLSDEATSLASNSTSANVLSTSGAIANRPSIENATATGIIEPVCYYQFDDKWAKQEYNDGRNNDKVRGSGCGPAVMAMAIATFVDKDIDPGNASKWSLDNGYFTPRPGRTEDEFFPEYGKKYGLEVTRLLEGDLREMPPEEALKYHEQATDSVKNGNWVIAFMGKGPWTTKAHFVLWYGLIDDEVLIRDSNSKKPEKARNKLSLFRETVIRYWVIDISKFREE